MYLALLLIMPFLILIGNYFFFHRKVTVLELVLQFGIVIGVVAAGVGIATWTSTIDHEIRSGKIEKKAKERVSCSHSYSCNCYTTTDSKGNVSTHCSTCYEHSYDIDWAYYSTENGRNEINRIDRQGLSMPPRWGTVFIGEPTSSSHRVTNYIKAAPQSVLRISQAPNAETPKYPEIFDYYHSNRFVAQGFTAPDAKDWNWLLDRVNADLGAKKQINIIMVAVNSADPNYEYALEKAWIGGKKNDLIILVGTPQYPQISWVRIFSWSKVDTLRVLLRDEILTAGQMNRRDVIIGSIRTNVEKHWIRRPMSDFKWLLASHQPGTGMTIFLFILGVALCIGSSYVVNTNRENPYGNW